MAFKTISLNEVYSNLLTDKSTSYYIHYKKQKFEIAKIYALSSKKDYCLYKIFRVTAIKDMMFENKSLDELRNFIIVDGLNLDELIEDENTVLYRNGYEVFREQLYPRHRHSECLPIRVPLNNNALYPEYLSLNKEIFELRKEKGLENQKESFINAVDSFSNTWNSLMAPYLAINAFAFFIYAYIIIFQEPEVLPTLCWVIFFAISAFKLIVYFMINKKSSFRFTSGESFGLFAKTNLLIMGLNFFLDFFFIFTIPFWLFFLFFVINKIVLFVAYLV